MAKITDLTWYSNWGGVMTAKLEGKTIQIDVRQKQPTLDAGCVLFLFFPGDNETFNDAPKVPPVQIETEPGNIQTFDNHLRSPALVELLKEIEGGVFEVGQLIASEVEILL